MFRFSHRSPTSPEGDWHAMVVPDRPSSRIPKRPGLALVLPLTEPLMLNGAVPPLLALFNDTMYPQFHAGDAVEAIVEVARHPLPLLQQVSESRREAVKKKFAEDVMPARNDLAAKRSILRSIVTGQQPGDQTLAGKDVDAALEALRKTNGDFRQMLEAGIARGIVDRINRAQAKADGRRDKAQKKWDKEKEKWDKEKDLVEIKRLEKVIDDLRKQIIYWQVQLPAATDAANAADGAPSAPVDHVALGPKFWAEFGFDPIRTADAVEGTPLAIRTDGAVGYTFDPETEAGRFDHAGLLISPVPAVGQRVRPWSMMKLSFRRFEIPEFLRELSDGTSLKAPVAPDGTDPGQSVPLRHSIRVANAWAATPVAGPSPMPTVVTFDTTHEGVVLDVPDLSRGFPVSVTVSFDGGDSPHVTSFEVTRKDDALRVDSRTELGSAAVWELGIRANASVSLRFTISLRPKPNDAETYRPAGDVSLRVRLTRRSETNVLAHPAENTWLSVLCMPLTARDKKGSAEPIFARFTDVVPASSVLRPVRLSDFTPGLWCQFAAAMSRFEADITVMPAGGAGRQVVVPACPVVVDQIRIYQKPLTNLTFQIQLDDIMGTVKGVTLRPEGQPDDQAQIEERIYVVVTRYVTDAFDRLRERPMAVFAAGVATLNLTERARLVWPRDDGEMAAATPFKDKSGRVRFLRVLWAKARVDGGVMPETTEKLRFESLFATYDNPNTGLDMEPRDAPGMALGISSPIEWG
jgi:hypothetical protein